MDIGRAFSYITEDERWITKMLIGGLVGILGGFILVGPLILLGYVIRTARNVANGVARPLPEWEDWGGFLTDGFKVFVIMLAYYIPYIVLYCIGGILSGVGAGSGEDAGGALIMVALCLQGIGLLVLLASLPFMFAGIARFTQTGDLGSALKFGEIMTMVRGNFGTWVMLALVYILGNIVGQLGLIALCIGIFISYPYGYAMFAHALGQVVAKMNGPNNLNTSGYNPAQYQ